MLDDKVGKFCSQSTCKQKDWMPVKCKYCQKYFCADHSTVDTHSCSEFKKIKKQVYVCPLCNKVIEVNANLTVEENFSVHEAMDCTHVYTQKVVPQCNWKKCHAKLTELNEHVCRRCRKKYCLKHRFEDDHDCLNCF